MPKRQFPANPIAGIQAISIADQTLRDISRRTIWALRRWSVLSTLRGSRRPTLKNKYRCSTKPTLT